VKAEGGNDGDAQGLEKHNQFLWAKKMGQQNEPRWGLFKQVACGYVCVRIRVYVSAHHYMCPHTITEQNEPRLGESSLLARRMRLYMCPQIARYVSSYYRGSRTSRAGGSLSRSHAAIYVSAYCYMCPHTTIYVSSYYYRAERAALGAL
jgi:hypothetical protein